MGIKIRKITTNRQNSSKRARKYLEDLAWRAEAKRTVEEMAEIIKKYSKPSKAGFAVKSIRGDRDAAH
jgi:hypothetical protein